MATTATDPATPSSSEIFPFLNHSADTVDRLQPQLDDKQLARQKRKRTSPEDAAILEAAYQRDPKPDKAARLELVNRVALDEKGVQIWFQNRRQTSRRKSRPLLPHEIAQYHMSRTGLAPTSLDSTFAPASLDDSSLDLPDDHPKSSQSQGDHDRDGMMKQASPHSSERSLSSHSQSAHRDAAVLPSFRHPSSEPYSASAVSSEILASVGYLANRRSVPFLRHGVSEQPILPPPMPIVAPKRQFRTSSFVRLSLNAEGKAEIVTKDASSPSPPRPPQVIYPEVPTSISGPLAPRSLQRSASGRSRDSRSWEFWCDKEARSQLGYAAEKDASGSAAGAIGLLRTASGRNVLGSIPSKRNSTLSRQHSSVKRSKLHHKRGPLQRSSNSLGILQADRAQGVPKLKHSDTAKMSCVKGTESDKENWSPDPEIGPEMQTNADTRPSHLASDRERPQQNVLATDDDPENDEELATFMHGGARKCSSTSGDELDCVQGLLSLSQGNWR